MAKRRNPAQLLNARRQESLTKEERSRIGKGAAVARWERKHMTVVQRLIRCAKRGDGMRLRSEEVRLLSTYLIDIAAEHDTEHIQKVLADLKAKLEAGEVAEL